MRILMLTGSLPYPPHQGGALRSYGILHGLKQAGHRLSLMSFHDHAAGARDIAEMKQWCDEIIVLPPPERSKTQRLRDLLFSDRPDIARRLYSPEFAQRLSALVSDQRFDLVQFEGIEIACYLPLLRSMNSSARLVYDAFNAEAALQRVIFDVDRGEPRRWPAAIYSLIQARRLAQYEHELCRQADGVIAVSDEDAAILRAFRPDACVPVVNNGIFADDYRCAGAQLELGDHALVFTGKMDYRPNVDAVCWFANDILPLIHRHVPDARLYVVGQKPHPRLERLRRHRQIEITGWVRDVQPFLCGASLYVAPLRMGSGTRLKLLEAMAAGRAVVATTTAISGMLPSVREVLVVADQPDQMASAVIALLQDPRRRQALGQAAQAFVKAHYDWSIIIPRLLAAYRDMGIG